MRYRPRTSRRPWFDRRRRLPDLPRMDEGLAAAVKALEGRRLWGSHRACDIQVMKFGARVEDVDYRGRPGVVGEWAVHLTGAWRIVCEGRVLVGQEDWDIPADGVDEDEFDRGVLGQSRRDRFVDRFMAHGEFAHLVDRSSVSPLGDLRLEFSDGCVLETFSAIGFVEPKIEDGVALADAECWRIFQPARDDPHFVIGTGGLLEAE